MKKEIDKYQGTKKPERASGDQISYFLLHNITSSIIFIIITISVGVYIGYSTFLGYGWLEIIGYVFSVEYLSLVFVIFGYAILSGIFGRILSFYIIKLYHKYYRRRSTKRWSEYNSGINRMGIRWMLAALITSLFYTIGIIAILSQAIFNEITLLPLMIIYFGLKIFIYLIVRWVTGSKL